MFDHVYATEHPVVTRERGWLNEYLAGFADSASGGHS